MKRSRFTVEQILGILSEQEKGSTVADISRKHGISDATFFNWKTKFGSKPHAVEKKTPELIEVKRLQDENAQLKSLLVEALLDLAAARAGNSKRKLG